MFYVETIQRVDELESLTVEWNRLADRSLCPNAFYEPVMLLPALEYLREESVSIACIHDGSSLRGLVPLREAKRWHRLPLPHLECWRHRHCFLTVPLIDRDRPVEIAASLLRWAQKRRPRSHLLAGDLIPGPTSGASLAVPRAHIQPGFSRAFLNKDCSFAEFHSALPAKIRKEFRRKQHRLQEFGPTEYIHHCAAADLESWIEDFLHLEKCGWKGRAGTALANSPADAAFFREVLRRAHRAGKLLLSALRVAGRPAAMRCSVISADRAFAFKTTFDERYRAASPGQLLELENVRFILDGSTGINSMDSCAAPNASLFHGLWRDSIAIMPASVAITSLGSLVQQLHRFHRRYRHAHPRRTSETDVGTHSCSDISPIAATVPTEPSAL